MMSNIAVSSDPATVMYWIQLKFISNVNASSIALSDCPTLHYLDHCFLQSRIPRIPPSSIIEFLLWQVTEVNGTHR